MIKQESREEILKQVQGLFVATIASEGGQGTKGLPLQTAVNRFRTDWPKSLDDYAKELGIERIIDLIKSFKEVRLFFCSGQVWVAPLPTEKTKDVLSVIDRTKSKKKLRSKSQTRFSDNGRGYRYSYRQGNSLNYVPIFFNRSTTSNEIQTEFSDNGRGYRYSFRQGNSSSYVPIFNRSTTSNIASGSILPPTFRKSYNNGADFGNDGRRRSKFSGQFHSQSNLSTTNRNQLSNINKIISRKEPVDETPCSDPNQCLPLRGISRDVQKLVSLIYFAGGTITLDDLSELYYKQNGLFLSAKNLATILGSKIYNKVLALQNFEPKLFNVVNERVSLVEEVLKQISSPIICVAKEECVEQVQVQQINIKKEAVEVDEVPQEEVKIELGPPPGFENVVNLGEKGIKEKDGHSSIIILLDKLVDKQDCPEGATDNNGEAEEYLKSFEQKSPPTGCGFPPPRSENYDESDTTESFHHEKKFNFTKSDEHVFTKFRESKSVITSVCDEDESISLSDFSDQDYEIECEDNEIRSLSERLNAFNFLVKST